MKLNPKWKKKRVVDSGYLDAVAALGCCLCQQPATIHHVHAGEGMGLRAADYRSIPLCPRHHQHGGYGIAIEMGRKAWEKANRTEEYWLEWTWDQLEIPEDIRVKWRNREYDI